MDSKNNLKKKLTPLQYKVTQENGTEPPFQNTYWDHKKDGIYVDVISGEPLFRSLDKYDSGTGWPSFTKTIDNAKVTLKNDFSLIIKRTEIRSTSSNSHLGHVFSDGPAPTKKRLCINSSALKFVAFEDLEKEGYYALIEDFVKPLSYKAIVLGGGCFWCMEPPFDNLEGVKATLVGYMGGTQQEATYTQVSSGKTLHKEVIKVIYDPKTINLEKIMDVFWKNIDPTVKNRQFCDHGPQYQSVILYQETSEKNLALATQKKAQKKLGPKTPILTNITVAQIFYLAEPEHQNYYKKNPIRYEFYKKTCGRSQRLKELWD